MLLAYFHAYLPIKCDLGLYLAVTAPFIWFPTSILFLFESTAYLLSRNLWETLPR